MEPLLVPERHEDASQHENGHDDGPSESSTPRSRTAQDDGSDESQQRFFQTQAYAADFQRAAQASHPKRAKFSSCFRLLVAGAPSTGKTTFIQNFASSCRHPGDTDFGSSLNSAQQPRLPHTLSSDDFVDSFSIEPTSAEDFMDKPDNLCTRVLLQDEAAKINYHVAIQDTPGFHEFGEEAEAIVSFIEYGNADYMRWEQARERPGPMTHFEDTRVDVCLYFIAPHSLRPVDISMIAAIGQRVPVVPVIGKGDSMTKAELEHFRKHISRELKIGAPGSNVYCFSEDLLQEAGIEESTQVFALISSCVVDASVGVHWPVRNYPWGFAEALNSAHSDAPALKRLLIELSFDDLKKLTDERYYTSYRPQQLKEAEEKVAQEAAARAEAERERLTEHALPKASKDDVFVSSRQPSKNRLVWLALREWLPKILVLLLSVLVVATMGGAIFKHAARPYTTRLSAACPDWHVIFSGDTPTCSLPDAVTVQQAPVPPKTCISTLKLAALNSPKQTHNRELWSLINLGRTLGSGRAEAPLCPQERGALAYQAAVALTELESLERKRAGIKQLPAMLRSEVRKKALIWRAALGQGAADVGHSMKAAADRFAHKMPVRTDDSGRMIVDVKALKRVIMRCGVMGFWF